MRTLTKARAVGLLSASALAAAGCGTSPTHAHRGEANARRTQCPAKALRAVPGPSVAAPTDELLIVFVLRNVTPEACSVQAIPRIALYGQQGSALPFEYRTSPASGRRRLIIDAHSRVFVVITKHPCTLHAPALAMSLSLGLARGESLHLRLHNAGSFDYCGAKDPSGHVVHMLPLARTLKSLLAGA
jgi:hypothetical protein